MDLSCTQNTVANFNHQQPTKLNVSHTIFRNFRIVIYAKAGCPRSRPGPDISKAKDSD